MFGKQALNKAADAVNDMSGDPAVREIVRQRYFAACARASLPAEGRGE